MNQQLRQQGTPTRSELSSRRLGPVGRPLRRRSVWGFMLWSTLACTQQPVHPPPPTTPFDALFRTQVSVALSRSGGDSVVMPAAALVRDSEIIVADAGAANLKVYNRRTGSLLRVIGGPGDERGEYRQPVAMAALPEVGYAVLDRRRHLVSVRSWTDSVLMELPIDGTWNDIAASSRAGHLVLAGTPLSSQQNRTVSLHEFDLTGRQTATCGARARTTSDLEASFSTPFLTRIGAEMVVGAFRSNEIRLCQFDGSRERVLDVAPGWYQRIIWPKRLSGPSTELQRVNAWANTQRLMTNLFALFGDRVLAQFRSTDSTGAFQYEYAVVDTIGQTLAISQPTAKQVLGTRGDTVYWVVHRRLGAAQLGASLLTLQRPMVSASAPSTKGP